MTNKRTLLGIALEGDASIHAVLKQRDMIRRIENGEDVCDSSFVRLDSLRALTPVTAHQMCGLARLIYKPGVRGYPSEAVWMAADKLLGDTDRNRVAALAIEINRFLERLMASTEWDEYEKNPACIVDGMLWTDRLAIQELRRTRGVEQEKLANALEKNSRERAAQVEGLTTADLIAKATTQRNDLFEMLKQAREQPEIFAFAFTSEVEQAMAKLAQLWDAWINIEESGRLSYPLLDCLAEAICDDIIKPRLKRKDLPSVTVATCRGLRKAVTRPGELQRLAASDLEIGIIASDVFTAIRMAKALRSPTGNRLIRLIVCRSFWQDFDRGFSPDFTPTLNLPTKELQAMLGAGNSGNNRKTMREALRGGTAVQIRIGSREIGGLWTYQIIPHAPGRPGRIKIDPSSFLRDSWRWSLPGAERSATREERAAARLVPVLPPSGDGGDEIPTGKLRGNEQGNAYLLHQCLLEHAALKSSEYADQKSIAVPWYLLADEADLPRQSLDALVSSWFDTILKEEGPGEILSRRASFKDKRLHEWFTRAGQRRLNASLAGKRSAAKRVGK